MGAPRCTIIKQHTFYVYPFKKWRDECRNNSFCNDCHAAIFFPSISLYPGYKDQQLTPIDYERIEWDKKKHILNLKFRYNENRIGYFANEIFPFAFTFFLQFSVCLTISESTRTMQKRAILNTKIVQTLNYFRLNFFFFLYALNLHLISEKYLLLPKWIQLHVQKIQQKHRKWP